jgi:hypothetical protein
MLGLILKVALTAIFIVALSEIGKRVPSVAGLIVALPLATAMTMTLMHVDGEGAPKNRPIRLVRAFVLAAIDGIRGRNVGRAVAQRAILARAGRIAGGDGRGILALC